MSHGKVNLEAVVVVVMDFHICRSHATGQRGGDPLVRLGLSHGNTVQEISLQVQEFSQGKSNYGIPSTLVPHLASPSGI